MASPGALASLPLLEFTVDTIQLRLDSLTSNRGLKQWFILPVYAQCTFRYKERVCEGGCTTPMLGRPSTPTDNVLRNLLLLNRAKFYLFMRCLSLLVLSSTFSDRTRVESWKRRFWTIERCLTVASVEAPVFWDPVVRGPLTECPQGVRRRSRARVEGDARP